MPLKLIGAGLGRTGTLSTKFALDALGYTTFHMEELNFKIIISDWAGNKWINALPVNVLGPYLIVEDYIGETLPGATTNLAFSLINVRVYLTSQVWPLCNRAWSEADVERAFPSCRSDSSVKEGLSARYNTPTATGKSGPLMAASNCP